MTQKRLDLINTAIRNFGMEDTFVKAFCRVAEGTVATDRNLEQILAMHIDAIRRGNKK